MGGSEFHFGTCDICKKQAPLQRTYFRYDIKCECHTPTHFDIVFHCSECTPKEPRTTEILIETKILKDLVILLRKQKIKKIEGGA